MQPEIWDISRLSHLRRSIAFPRRVAQAPGIFLLLVASVLVAYLAVAIVIGLMSPEGYDWGPPISPEQFVGGAWMVIFSTLLFFSSRGSRIAIVASLAVLIIVMLAVAGPQIFYMVTGKFAYLDVPVDLTLEQGQKLDYSADIRLLARRLMVLVVLAVFVCVAWRMAQAWFPRRGALSPRDVQFVFTAPPRFALIAQNLRHYITQPWRVGALLQSLLSAVFFIVSLFLGSLAATLPFKPTAKNDYVTLNSMLNHQKIESLLGMYGLEIGNFLAYTALALLLFPVAKGFLYLSNSSLIMSADRARGLDRRPPVLYLRSFRNDRLPSRDPAERSVLAVFDPYQDRATFEELIVRRTHSLGPVVAIADPKLKLLPFGAARKRTADLNWHDVVKGYMADAVCVVVLMDFTENLKWEVERLVEGGHIANTWFIFPPMTDRQHYHDMLAIAAEAVFPGEPNPFEGLHPDQQVCALARRSGHTQIIVSRTATLADYDIALQKLVADRSVTLMPVIASEGPAATISIPSIGALRPVADGIRASLQGFAIRNDVTRAARAIVKSGNLSVGLLFLFVSFWMIAGAIGANNGVEPMARVSITLLIASAVAYAVLYHLVCTRRLIVVTELLALTFGFVSGFLLMMFISLAGTELGGITDIPSKIILRDAALSASVVIGIGLAFPYIIAAHRFRSLRKQLRAAKVDVTGLPWRMPGARAMLGVVPRWRASIAFALFSAGILAYLGVGMGLRVSASGWVFPGFISAGAFIASVVLLIAGHLVLRNASGRLLRRPGTALVADQRALVVFFRSFEARTIRARSTRKSALWPLLRKRFDSEDSFEEQLMSVLAASGSIIAVGRPGETATSVSGAQECLVDDAWRIRASQLNSQATLFVIIVGDTTGIGLQAAPLLASSARARVLFVVPPVDEVEAARIWSAVRSDIASTGGDLAGLPETVTDTLVFAVGETNSATIRLYTATDHTLEQYELAISLAIHERLHGPLPQALTDRLQA